MEYLYRSGFGWAEYWKKINKIDNIKDQKNNPVKNTFEFL